MFTSSLLARFALTTRRARRFHQRRPLRLSAYRWALARPLRGPFSASGFPRPPRFVPRFRPAASVVLVQGAGLGRFWARRIGPRRWLVCSGVGGRGCCLGRFIAPSRRALVAWCVASLVWVQEGRLGYSFGVQPLAPSQPPGR